MRRKLLLAVIAVTMMLSVDSYAKKKKGKRKGKKATPELSVVNNKTYQEVVATATDVPVDIYTISDKVKIKKPLNFGANFNGSISPKPWYNSCMLNAWNERKGMEPYTFKKVFLITADSLSIEQTPNDRNGIAYDFLRGLKVKGQKKKISNGGISGFNKYDITVWKGGEAYLYKLVNGRYIEVHKTKIKEVIVEPILERPRKRGGKIVNYDQRERLVFETPMPKNVEPLKKGDVIILQGITTDISSLMKSTDKKNIARFKKSSRGFFTNFGGAKETIDMNHKCPEGGSTASMKVILAGAGEENKGSGMQQPFLHRTPTPRGWLELTKGAAYKCQIWLRQEGMEKGEVTVNVAGIAKKTFLVTDKWQKFILDIPADSQDKVGPEKIGALSVSSLEKGTIWIDNFLVWEADKPQFAFGKNYLKALKDYKPGHLRYWASFSKPIHSVLQHGWATPENWQMGRRVNGSDNFSMHTFLSVCKELKAEPWIILKAEQTDEDIKHFMEYIGAPADVGYGKLRASHGQKEPWTTIFKDILVECHNEAWGKGYGPYWLHPDIYIGMTNRMFYEIKQSPYYNKKQFMLIANGRSGHESYQRHYKTGELQKDKPQWSMQIALGATEADSIDAAYYIGGADGLTVLGKNDTDFYGKQLMYTPRIIKGMFDNIKILHKAVAEKIPGKKYIMNMYEGGPGYPTPSAKKPFTATGEQVGKSMALGVTTLDTYMLAQAGGFYSQAYFGFALGNNFSSHAKHNDMYAWPSFLGLQMRNNYCSGDLMEVEETKLKRVNFPAEIVTKMSYDNKRVKKRKIKAVDNIAFSRCFAFKDGNKHSFLLMNRHYNEPITVELKLPYNPKSEVKIYFLSDKDPRTSNRDKKQVVIQETSKNDFSKNYKFKMDPASIYILVNEEK